MRNFFEVDWVSIVLGSPNSGKRLAKCAGQAYIPLTDPPAYPKV